MKWWQPGELYLFHKTNLDDIYRKTVQGLRIGWLEIRDEAQYLYGVSLSCPH